MNVRPGILEALRRGREALIVPAGRLGETATAIPLRALLYLIVALGALPATLEAQSNISQGETEKIYKLGITSADVDTPIEKYMATVNGVDAQCGKLNSLLEAVCCGQYDIGCNVKYSCETVAMENEDLMEGIADLYEREENHPNYAIHHGGVLQNILLFFDSLEIHGRSHGMLVVAYTRHWIRVDDEETKTPANKIDPYDLSFYFLGTIMPGKSEREGKKMLLDYYAAESGIIMSVSPVNETGLAQALSEYRASLFSFNEKQFTGTGSRDLFELDGRGDLIPNMSGCTALAEMEPAYYRALLNFKRQAD